MKRSFDVSLLHSRKYVSLQPDDDNYERDDYEEIQKYYTPNATEEEQRQFEKELESFVETQDVTSIHSVDEPICIEFTKLEAYQQLPLDVYDKIKQHPYLLFCEQALEDVDIQFKDDEDLERYLRSMAGIERNIKQDREQTHVFECRFVTKVVQEAELEDVEVLDDDEDLENFDATSLKGSQSIVSILEASNMDDLSSSLEDYCIVHVFLDKFKITHWKLTLVD